MNKKWTYSEKEYIRKNANFKTDKELAQELTAISRRIITLAAVRKIRQKMGLKKQSGRGICKIKS